MKKNLLFSLVALFVCLCAKAQGSDDFSTLTVTQTYAEYTSAAGWVGKNCQVITNADLMGDAQAFVINGKTSAVGSITSPALTGGCGTLTINYAYPYAESKGVSFHVAVMQNGAVAKEYDVVDTSLAKLAAAVSTTEINVEGDFSIVITNNSPSASTKNKDRYAIWGITWTGYGENGGDTGEGEGEGEGGETTDPETPVVDVVEPVIAPDTYYHANTVDVTITAEDGLTVYYTIDGTDPTTESSVYSAPITINATDATAKVTVKAIAVDAEGNVSDVVSATYNVYVVKPMEIPEGCVGFDFVMNPWGYTLGYGQNETAEAGNITAPIAQDGATISFDQADASVPARMWSSNGGGQLRVYKNSTFTITAPEGKVITAIDFNTSKGTITAEGYSGNQWTGSAESVTFTCTVNAQINTILLTLADNTDEGEGEGEGGETTDPETPVVDVVEPVIAPDTQYHANTVDVTITAEEGLTVYYTIDGTDPTTESAVYSAPITISATDATVEVTVKAIAVDAEGNVSDIVSATYTVNVVKGMEVPEGCVGFDFVMNPWGYTLGYGSGATAEAGNLTSPIVQDGVTFSFEGGSTPTRMWSFDGGGQLRVYKEAVLTFTAPEGKVITSMVFDIKQGTFEAGNGSWDAATGTWTGSEESAIVKVAADSKTGQVRTILVTLADKPAVVVEAPEITPATGTYLEAQTVTITAGEGYSIFYTLDGTDPTDASTLYEGPFTVSETTTIKAIATNDDDVASTVTTSVITILPVYTSIADMLAVISSTKAAVAYKFENLLVQGVKGSNVFVHDGTNAFLIYSYGSGLKAGDKISGTVTGNLYTYNNLPELALTGDKFANVTVVSEGNDVVPATKTIADLTTATINEYVRLGGLTYVETSGSNFTFTDGTNSISIYEKSLLSGVTFSTEEVYTITAFVGVYGETIQLTILSADDVVGVPTAINGIEIEDADAPKVIYTISGQRVSEITKGGIYIINGKKVLVK